MDGSTYDQDYVSRCYPEHKTERQLLLRNGRRRGGGVPTTVIGYGFTHITREAALLIYFLFFFCYISHRTIRKKHTRAFIQTRR